MLKGSDLRTSVLVLLVHLMLKYLCIEYTLKIELKMEKLNKFMLGLEKNFCNQSCFIQYHINRELTFV